MEQQKKSSNKLAILLVVIFVGGFALLTCGGILAAVAIPAFIRYTNASKATEAAATTRRLASVVEMGYAEMCKFPDPLPPTFDPAAPDCCGGQKCLPDTAASEYWRLNSAAALESPNYFSYTAVPGPDNTFVITARADFQCGGPQHTVTLTVQGAKQGESCTASSSPPQTTNEYE